MNRETLLAALRRELDDDVWHPDPAHAAAREPAWRERLAAADVRPLEVLDGCSDEGLVLAIQNDFFPHDACTLLHEGRYRRPYYRWYVRWAGSLAGVLDAWQDLMLHLWTNRYRPYDPHGGRAVWPYFAAIAHNRYRDHGRRRQHPTQDSGGDVVDRQPGPDVEAEWRELEEQVRAALETLDERTRQVFGLTLDGCTNEQIREALGVSLQVVANIKHRGRGKLRPALERLTNLRLE